MRTRPAARALTLSLAAVALPGTATAFCRTTTCPLPADFSPSDVGMCQPEGFAEECAALDPPNANLVLWWRNACVSYDIQQDTTLQVPYADASRIAAVSFAQWTGTFCDDARVSIDVADLGPVQCDEVAYSSTGPNQHVIFFHGDSTGGSAATTLDANTLALTTVTFDPTTGEIFDADMDINATVPLAIEDPVPIDGFDLQSIVTHEAGHFLGMAHSVEFETTMYARYSSGSISKRTLSDDDRAGICAIYPPGGARSVDPSVAASGLVASGPCDPTPRHGFQSACSSTPLVGCAATAGPARGAGWLGASALALLAAARRRRGPRGARARRG